MIMHKNINAEDINKIKYVLRVTLDLAVHINGVRSERNLINIFHIVVFYDFHNIFIIFIMIIYFKFMYRWLVQL